MRIPKAWVPLLAKKIVDNIISKELIKPAISIKKLLLETEELILNELTIEDRLNEEVRELLKIHASEIEQGRLDYRRLFELTKQKLARERNLVL
ncbi:MAG: DUF507 domain-containing protein [Nitrospirae bacterium CG_4_10_14_0_8_um_filter_41_23]|nr:DUF507 family protein [Nitrospirota bacterium]PIQ94658.1 MAG: hypothetical protein COV68_03470 [Nitrospirae bacterium CG11_big_fil_rev_8_21_14_0_20_41_14]PIV41118.1 MAG: DUF507 domain-containing protein [Nitrospirae bacterium CG02_land_8_20_14_3_00_41_53]PIW88113.1 MAG: DUF507 domain-containing protein [Nitrospirae bacterium CG_4_8_14_3_um_filter_41_47]PIY87378.1 MAG: DUF507 domain-containing protein [Nitrospirae bacterium CG_4_10_14_0_8_um_filter_41_23]PJA79715.1 MAG: DUF507 domain-contain